MVRIALLQHCIAPNLSSEQNLLQKLQANKKMVIRDSTHQTSRFAEKSAQSTKIEQGESPTNEMRPPSHDYFEGSCVATRADRTTELEKDESSRACVETVNDELSCPGHRDEETIDCGTDLTGEEKNKRETGNKQAGDDIRQSQPHSMLQRAMQIVREVDWYIKLLFGYMTRYAVKAIFLLILAFCIFTIAVFVGAKLEGRHIERAASTLSFYETESVCAIDSLALGGAVRSMSLPALHTFETLMDARDSGKEVAHCGSCGSCSNVNDIDIMARTRGSLTGTTTDCAKRVFFGGRRAVESCMKQNVGFTDSCSDCWVDNVLCTQKRCKFTCIKSLFYLREGNNKSGKLNACLECDEKLCGPQFIQCSGANRRRLGITSDIQRDAVHEQCHSVELDWTQEAEMQDTP